ncbi:hypothetical protein Tco_0964237, partial [Tanacetum coccineum]
DKYVADILKKFDFVTVKTASTPIEPNKAFVKNEEAEDVDVHLYRSMIGSLMYLTASRPDITFDVCACARFQVTPKISHLHAVKRIFRYLKGQPNLGLWYPRNSPFDLEAFSDSDYARASLYRKSTTGCCQFLGKGLISWQCKKHTIVANSTIKAEYVAAANFYGQNLVFHSKTKHMEIRHHFIRDSYEKKLIQVIKIHTDHNLADLLTKAFDVNKTIYKEWEDRMERAATTASSLEAEQDSEIEVNAGVLKLMLLSLKLNVVKLNAKTTSLKEFSSTMASAIICLATNQKFNFSKYIFDNMVKNLDGGVEFLMYPRFVQVFLVKQVEGMSKHKGVYVIPSHTKKVFDNMKRPCKGFSGRVTPLFSTMMVQATEDMEPTTEETTPKKHVSTPFYALPPSEKTKTAQAKEITSLKKRVKQLEKIRKSRTSGLRWLRKVGSSSKVESFNDASLVPQKDASKQGRKIKDLDADAEVTLVNETQEMNDDNLMFDTDVLEEQEIDASVVIPDKLTRAQMLIEIKTAKLKPITTAATTVTSVRPRAKGIIFHDQEEQVSAFIKTFSSLQSQLPQVKGKGKGKGKMVEPKVPLKKKDQVSLDEEMARNLEAQLQAELIEEEGLARQKEEEANIALIESWDNTQAMMEADLELA